jgi:hypothetical protein
MPGFQADAAIAGKMIETAAWGAELPPLQLNLPWR